MFNPAIGNICRFAREPRGRFACSRANLIQRHSLSRDTVEIACQKDLPNSKGRTHRDTVSFRALTDNFPWECSGVLKFSLVLLGCDNFIDERRS